MLIHRGSSFNPIRVSFFISRRGEHCETERGSWAEESLRQESYRRDGESEYTEMSTACGGGSIMECARRCHARVDGFGARRRVVKSSKGSRINEPGNGNEEMTPVTRQGDNEAKVVKPRLRWHPPCQWTTPLGSLAEDLLDYGDVAASCCLEQLLVLAHGPFTPRSSRDVRPHTCQFVFSLRLLAFHWSNVAILSELTRRRTAA